MINIAHWLDWCFFAYKEYLVIYMLAFGIGHMYLEDARYALDTLPTSLLIGVCIWLVHCYVKQGVAVG